MIKEGDVTVSGRIVTQPAAIVPDGSRVKVLGKLVREESEDPKTRVWIVHKLYGEIVAENDPLDRPSLLDRLKKGGVGKRSHLKPIGRLDMSSEGLILMTNDGSYAREMELPSNRFVRTYRVRAHGNLTHGKMNALRKGMTINGTRYKGMRVQLDVAGNKRRERAANFWLTIKCTEGKNRQVRKMLQFLRLKVNRLIRTSFGDYDLKNIPAGMAVEVPAKPIKTQKNTNLFKPATPKKNSIQEENPVHQVQWIKTIA